MSPPDATVFDFQRAARIGQGEAVYCASKTPAQIAAILEHLDQHKHPVLLTRLEPDAFAALPPSPQAALDYDPLSRTAFFRFTPPTLAPPRVAIVSAGTSDAPVCGEAARTLLFNGQDCQRFEDIGVAGLWRLLERVETLRQFPIIIAVAGMEGAIFSVLGGLVGSTLIAVPTSTGYGVTAGGHAALHAALGSCAQGLVTVNIDNGFGAACAALRMLGHS